MEKIQNYQQVTKIKEKPQYQSGLNIPGGFDYIGYILEDLWGDEIVLKKNGKKQKQNNKDGKKFNYMPVIAVQLIQKIEDQVWFHDVVDYGDEYDKAQKVKQLFKIMIKKVLLNNKKIRRNKKFLRMIFNPVNEELNNAIKNIKRGRVTKAEEIYFDLILDFGEKAMNWAKTELRVAFERALTERWIELQALNKKFKVDEALKQKILMNYLMKIKFELRKGEISGNVDGKQVEECFTFNMEE